MKLEVGMYVRFKDKRGNEYIRKVIDGYKKSWYGCKVDIEANNVPYVSLKNIIKASYNIIDLIEAGDYVNGYKIGYIYDCKGAMREFYYDYENPNDDVGHWEEEIKTVVTHEQMEQMKYIVEE